jgi:hypothetical protein
MLKKLSIIIADLLLHFGLLYPLWELPGHMFVISLVLIPVCILFEKKVLGFTFGEIINGRSFVTYPHLKNLFKPSIYVRPKIKETPRKILKIFLPLLAFLSFIMTEPTNSFNISSAGANSVFLEELNCSFVRPIEGELHKGVLKLPRNGGNLQVQDYTMHDTSKSMHYVVQRAFMHKDWTHYPSSIVMKGAVFVVLDQDHLDKVLTKQSGTHNGNKSTTIKGECKGETCIIRVILHKDQIYNLKVSFPKDQPELEQEAIDFLNSISFAK